LLTYCFDLYNGGYLTLNVMMFVGPVG
jgi:hypothetical protein